MAPERLLCTGAAREHSAACRVPLEVWERTYGFMEPEDVLRVRGTSRAMLTAGRSVALWRQMGLAHGVDAVESASSELPESHTGPALERAVLVARRVNAAWQTHGAAPRRVIRFRAHVSRITSVKLVCGPNQGATPNFLVTGSVDGFVRVWDVARCLRQRDAMDVTAATQNAELEQGEDTLASSVPTDPTHEIHQATKTMLVADVDTGGDVTSLDAYVDATSRKLVIAVGSYYNAAGCLLYVLDLDSKPHVMDMRASLEPPEWCGTQCVSLCGSWVGVGTYTGRLYLLQWKTGERCLLSHMERGSLAAILVLPTHVLGVTRLGHLTVWARDPEHGTGTVVAEHTLTTRPLLTAAFSKVQQDPPAGRARLTLLCADTAGLMRWTWPAHADWTVRPEHTVLAQLEGERFISASLGASGERALVATSLGGVPPLCAVRAFTPEAGLQPLRATPMTAVPASSAPAPMPATAPRLPTAVESRAQSTSPSLSPTRPRRVREDSFSSTSTSLAPPSPSPRVDMLTETAFDEARGLVCLASVRGAVWIADYGGWIDTI